MKAKHSFDFIHDTQAVFRILLDALANPLRIEQTHMLAEKFTSNGEWLSLAVSLLDGEVEYYSDLSEDIKREIHFLTGSEETQLENADFVFLEKGKPGEILPKVKSGTHLNPHLSALIVIKSKGIYEESMSFFGPGIPPEGRAVLLSREEKEWITMRDQLVYEYPCGIEIMFLRESGEILAVTRKAGVKEWHM